MMAFFQEKANANGAGRSMSRLVLFLALMSLTGVFLWRIWAESRMPEPLPPSWCLTAAAGEFENVIECGNRALAHDQARAERIADLLGRWVGIIWAALGAYLGKVLGVQLPKLRSERPAAAE